MNKKEPTLTQCEFRQETKTGYKKKVCWIPTHGAVVNNTMSLDGVEGRWTVVHVGSTQPERLIKDQAHKSNDIWTATSGPQPRGNK